MRLILRGTTKNYDRHRVMIFTAHVPNILEYLFLWRRMKLVNYVGAGKKWKQMHVNGQVQLHEITDPKIIKDLEGWYNGEKFYQRNQNIAKTMIVVLAAMLMSCGSLLFDRSEVFTRLSYSYDSTVTVNFDSVLFSGHILQIKTPGCKDALVITRRLSNIGVGALSFYLNVGKHKIEIPRMEMNTGHAEYIGRGVDGKLYTVKYFMERKETQIHVRYPDGHTLIVSSNCNRG